MFESVSGELLFYFCILIWSTQTFELQIHLLIKNILFKIGFGFFFLKYPMPRTIFQLLQDDSCFTHGLLYKIHEKWKHPDIWAEFGPNIFQWQGLLLSVPVDTNDAKAESSHISLNRAFMFTEYHSLCVVGAIPWTKAICPAGCCLSNCQHFAMSTKFQVQTHYIANSISIIQGEKYPKLLQLPFIFDTIIFSLNIQVYLKKSKYVYLKFLPPINI